MTALITHQCFSSCWITFVQHQGHLFLIMPLQWIGWGCTRGWEGTQPCRWPKLTKRDISHYIISCLVVKCSRAVFRELSCLSHGNWLGISLPVGGGEWLCFHHLFCFVCSLSSSNFPLLFKLFLSWPMNFLAFTPPFLLLYLTGGQGWGRVS